MTSLLPTTPPPLSLPPPSPAGGSSVLSDLANFTEYERHTDTESADQ